MKRPDQPPLKPNFGPRLLMPKRHLGYALALFRSEYRQEDHR